MSNKEYIIEIESASPAEASRYAEELKTILRGASFDIEVKRRRSDPNALDFGSTLVLILGTAGGVVLAKAVRDVSQAFRDWINSRHDVKITVKSSKGEILIEGMTAKDAHKILELLNSEE